MKVAIGYSSKEDIPGIIEIEKASFSLPWGEEVFGEKLDSLLAAKIEGRVAAYILFEKIADELHIIRLAVHPEFRRRGIAKNLVETVLEQTRGSGVKSVYLEVRESNLASKKLYESLGFDIIGKRKSYYTNPDEDALIMAKKI